MKKPQSPPSIHDIVRSIGAERLSLLVDKMGFAEGTDRYLHWDDFRRRPAPEGVPVAEAWVITKLRRQAGRRLIPLCDERGREFSFVLPHSLERQLHSIDRGLGSTSGRVQDDGVLDPRSRDYMILQEAIASSQLEGAATTRIVAKEMLRSGRVPRDKGERMIRNNYLTMQRVRELKDTDLTPEILFELHSTAKAGTLENPDQAGRVRHPNEDVRIEDEIEGTLFHRPPPSESLGGRLAAMCEFANGRTPSYFIHPVVRAIILHFWLAYDHPFVDGNGRTARALFYWAMLREKYALFEFISISEVLVAAPIPYYTAFLHTETDDNDLTYFILHQAQVIHKATETLDAYVAARKLEERETERKIGSIDGLNLRQRAVIAHALKEPHTVYVIPAHMRSHGISHQTARDDLFGLVEKTLLTRTKAGRGYHFRSAPDLRGKLATLQAG